MGIPNLQLCSEPLPQLQRTSGNSSYMLSLEVTKWTKGTNKHLAEWGAEWGILKWLPNQARIVVCWGVPTTLSQAGIHSEKQPPNWLMRRCACFIPPTTRVHSESSTREGCPTVQEPTGGSNSQSLYLQLVYGHKFKLSSAIRSILANPIHLLFKEISHFLLDFL